MPYPGRFAAFGTEILIARLDSQYQPWSLSRLWARVGSLVLRILALIMLALVPPLLHPSHGGLPISVTTLS